MFTEGEAADDGGAEAWVSKGLDPAAEAADAGERDGGLFLAFGQDLEQQLGAALVELQVDGLIEAEQLDATVGGNGRGQLAGRYRRGPQVVAPWGGTAHGVPQVVNTYDTHEGVLRCGSRSERNGLKTITINLGRIGRIHWRTLRGVLTA